MLDLKLTKQLHDGCDSEIRIRWVHIKNIMRIIHIRMTMHNHPCNGYWEMFVFVNTFVFVRRNRKCRFPIIHFLMDDTKDLFRRVF